MKNKICRNIELIVIVLIVVVLCGVLICKNIDSEDFFDATVAGENLPEEVFEYYQAFDVDEYVAMYLEAKQNGLAGVPNARGLVEDAEDMEARLEELAIKLSGIKEE